MAIPVLDCSLIQNQNLSCASSLPPVNLSLLQVTGCGTDYVKFVHHTTNGQAGCPGLPLIITRYYIADCDGDTLTTLTDRDTCIQIFTFIDSTPPMLTCPPDLTIECGSSMLPANTGVATATDGCDATPTLTYYDFEGTPPASPNEMRWVFLPPGTSTGSCTSGSNCAGNIVCFGLQYTPGVEGHLTSYTTGFFVDCVNGNDPILSNTSCLMSTNAFEITDCANTGLILMNASGNTGNALIHQYIPIILHQVCFQLTNGEMTNIEEDETTNLTVSIDLAGGGQLTELPIYTGFDLQYDTYCIESCAFPSAVYRRFLATDDCGNQATCLQKITIKDTTPPTVICPPNVTIQCNGNTSTTATGVATVTDNCDSAPVLSLAQTITTGLCGAGYIISRTWSAIDKCGNTSSCTQQVTVGDTAPPSVFCPPDITVQAFASTDPAATGTATATDVCDTAPIVIYLDSIGGVYCPVINRIYRKWIGIDACGNQGLCIQQITIQDKGTICGSVHDDLGQVIGGVQIQLMADLNGNQMLDGGDTLVTSLTSSVVDGGYCFTNVRPCNYILVENQPANYGSLSDYDISPDPDGNDSGAGPNNRIPVVVSPLENDIDNNFIDIICPTLIPALPLDTICSGQSVMLVIPNQNLGALTYTWDFGSGSSPGTGLGLGPHTVSYITTTSNQISGASVMLTIAKAGCSNLTGQVTQIDVNPYPNAAINGGPDSICYYTNKIFQPVAAAIPGATYNWTFDTGAVPATATGYGPHNVYYTSSGTKVAKLVIRPNEPGAQCADSSTLTFTIQTCAAQILGYVLSNLNAPIQNVTLKLYADNDLNGMADNTTAIRTVSSTASGFYAMATITPGHYVIVQTQPTAWTSFDDYDASDDGDLVINISGTDNIIPVSLYPSEVDSMNNFIEVSSPGSISGTVFDDYDADMSPDAGEGISGVIVNLFSDVNTDGVADNGTPVATQTTNVNGNFIFTAITIGSYVMVEMNPSGYTSIKDYDATNDGDAVPNTDMNNDIIPVTVTSNEADAQNFFIDDLPCSLLVTNTADLGLGSLRYAISCASPNDTIRFAASLAGQTIMVTSEDIDINKPLVIMSTLSPTVNISSSTMGLFNIQSVTVEFRDLNVMSGNALMTQGAAFDNNGILKLHNIHILRNPSYPSIERLINNKIGGDIIFSGSIFLED